MTYRYFIHLGFKGTHYHGWQVQPNSVTVQEVLNMNISRLLRQNIWVVGCGRTDTGVHASSFFAHFDTDIQSLDAQSKFIYHLNCMLPDDIVIYGIYSVSVSSHARFDAISRTYLYRICQQKNPFNLEFVTHYGGVLDLNAMNQASTYLLKYTDFTSFSKLHTDVKTNNCRIISAAWTQKDHEVQFLITADRFLRNMVRAIVGSLLDVGRDKIKPSEFEEIILKKDRSVAGMSVPAKGLHLIQISYPELFQFK